MPRHYKDTDKWPFHPGHVENRGSKRGMWTQWFGPNYKELVNAYGSLEEEYQACQILYERRQLPEITWAGGGQSGCTLDFSLKVPSFTVPDKKYELTCKMGKIIEDSIETDRLNFLSLAYSNKEELWKNITRLEGPSHTGIVTKMYIYHHQKDIIDNALEEGCISKKLKVDPIFPKNSLQETLDNNFVIINPIYRKLCHKERKASEIIRQYILYSLTDAVRREDQEHIKRFMETAA